MNAADGPEGAWPESYECEGDNGETVTYRQLTPEDLTERWKPDPLSDREMIRTRYLGPDGVTVLVVEHPQAVPPPTVTLHDVDLGAITFTYDGIVE